MKFAKRLLMVSGAVALAGVVGVALVPRAAHAIVSTLVTVVNTPNVNVANTPSVNVNGMPAVNVASVSGKLSVANSIDGNGNPIPLGTQSADSSPVEVTCEIPLKVNAHGVFCSPYTVPGGKTLIVDYVSIWARLGERYANEAGFEITPPSGANQVIFYMPFPPYGSDPDGSLEFSAAQEVHLQAAAGSSPGCGVTVNAFPGNNAAMVCAISGHLVPAP